MAQIKYRKRYSPRRQTMINERVFFGEEALGKRLPAGCEMFDYNGQLVVCQDRAYNRLLHARAKSYDTYGTPDIRKCHICGEDDLEENLYFPTTKKGGGQYHKSCHFKYCVAHFGTAYRFSKLYCQRGHWIDGRNDNQRFCKVCRSEALRKHRANKKEGSVG